MAPKKKPAEKATKSMKEKLEESFKKAASDFPPKGVLWDPAWAFGISSDREEDKRMLNVRRWKPQLEKMSYSRLFVLTEPNVYEHVYLPHKEFLPEHVLIMVPAGESAKTLQTATLIWQQLQQHAADRQALMINLGGGMITDLGGFAASVYARGIRFINAPTSLLAMADACIGGKTGLNFMGIKNQLGSFSHPFKIWADTNFLKSLPEREYKAGMAEIYKLHILNHCCYGLWPILADDMTISLTVEAAMKYKERICKEDPREKGIRASLNLGHTIGHALESWSQDKTEPLLHGEAVALGLLAEMELLIKHGYLSRPYVDLHIEKLKKLAPGISISSRDADEVCKICVHDKKNLNDKIRIAAIREGLGYERLIEIEAEEIKAVLMACFGNES